MTQAESTSLQKTVSLGVIAYNEHRYLPDLLQDILKQTYPKNLTEILLVDGNSADDTLQIMKNFQAEHEHDFKSVKVLNNSKRIQPAGWNVVIRNFTSNVLLRIDAHARLPEDFIEKNMNCINTGEYVCGGPRENIIDEDTPWKRALLSVEQSMFGSGIASYRQGTEEKKYVKSLFHGAYRREVIKKVGLFNEDLVRTEDNEYHYRIRKAGYKICYNPQINSYYQTRNSLSSMLKQKFQNGLWIGKTLFVCPECISIFHLVPFAFVMAIIFTSLLVFWGITWPMNALWITYVITNFMIIMLELKSIYNVPIILVVHCIYGLGTMEGIVMAIITIVKTEFDVEIGGG